MEKAKKTKIIIGLSYLILLTIFVMLFFSAAGMYYLENPTQPENFSSIIDSFWWAVSSLTGVGFEYVYPLTNGGKVFGTIISLVGVGVVAVPTGIKICSGVIVKDLKPNISSPHDNKKITKESKAISIKYLNVLSKESDFMCIYPVSYLFN